MRLRDGRPGDGRAIEQVRTAGWRAAYAGVLDAGFLAALAVDDDAVARRERMLAAPQPGEVVLVAEQAGVVVGACVLVPGRDADLAPGTSAELALLYVRPDVWARGVGGRLLEAGFDRAPAPLQVLWALEGNAAARRFYERRGFRADGARRVLDLGGPAPEVRYRRAGPPGPGPGPRGPATP